MTETATRIYRNDYTQPNYWAKTVDLFFDIGDTRTRVTSTSAYVRNEKIKGDAPLVLNGADISLISLSVDGKKLDASDYSIEGEELTIKKVPATFTLEVITEFNPKTNTALEGLYASGDMLCTQCEAEGFRRITYYPDRPDVMAVFTTTIEADKKTYPVLLSNGNCTKREELGARQRVTWHDPHPKPCYLFALVAGDLVKIEDYFTTMSGRKVTLQIFSDPGKEDQLHHAMESLKKSFAWDEKRFGREYDLDIFMIVAASFFNSGAMENKGLNIFNAAYVLGNPQTATDRDLQGIESVIAHEYFHNWSGNRVTCRDWFQLSLKEGFTVFRDQEFSRDVGSPATERIDHVRLLRNHQFPEDAGPMAHPVRPDSYITIDNFYTTTVYEKGAEVVRMLQTLFGMDGFRKGTDLYFSRHDGQAVTCDDFAQAIFDANPQRAKEISLDQFKLWYAQAGTPRLKVESTYNAQKRTYTLKILQNLPAKAGQNNQPMLMPVSVALLNGNGADMEGTNKVLVLNKAEQEFVFEGIAEKPVPSLLRHFSAPVVLEYDYTDTELAFLAAHDGDLFNRWEALQQLAQKELRTLIAAHKAGKKLNPPTALLNAFAELLKVADKDPQFTAQALALPGEAELGQMMLRDGQKIDVDAIHESRDFVRRCMATQFKPQWLDLYSKINASLAPLATDGVAMGQRALKNTCLTFLGLLETPETDQLAFQQFERAQNMTDAVAALGVLTQREGILKDSAFASFFEKWKGNDLILDKWFALQAQADKPDVLDKVQALMQHPAFTFTNPNKIFALVGGFCANLPHFHNKDGKGYRFLADVILRLDAKNPQVAGRRLNPLARWKDYDDTRGAFMRAELKRIAEHPGLSKNTLEVALAGLGSHNA